MTPPSATFLKTSEPAAIQTLGLSEVNEKTLMTQFSITQPRSKGYTSSNYDDTALRRTDTNFSHRTLVAVSTKWHTGMTLITHAPIADGKRQVEGRDLRRKIHTGTALAMGLMPHAECATGPKPDADSAQTTPNEGY